MAFQRTRKPVPAPTIRAMASPSAPRPFSAESEALPPRPSSAFSYISVPVHPPGGASPARGLPGGLKQGIEGATGVSLEGVRVHYNSARPAGLRALAYAAGDNIYLGPNQERHLPHEAWHTVQQRQGRVRPTGRMEGAAINDDPLLEREATEMGGQAARGVTPALPPALPQLGAGGANPVPVIQRMPANQAYNDAMAQLGDWDIGGNYLDVVGANTEAGAQPAFIVNAILSYREVGNIPAVIHAMTNGLGPALAHGVAVVLGINAPDDEAQELDQAIAAAQEAIGEFGFPVAIVRSTFPAGRPFPYGQMRNEVMHSPETAALTRLFANAGFHPYVSSQDFDTSSRILPGPGARHIFDAVHQALDQWPDEDEEEVEERSDRRPRPLMIAGGYRPGPDLVARTIERFQEKEEDVPEELTRNNGEAFLQQFNEHIYHDMASRQVYAEQHPLLPYSPEPNLFLDALAVAYGSQLGLDPLDFGPGAAEFTQLAKNLGQYERAELAHHYSSLHASAPPSLGVGNSMESSAMVEELPADQVEIESRLSADAQTGRHPRRDLTYLVDFTGLAVETDLSRLARSKLMTGKDPQSHIGLTMVADRFFQDKGAKSQVSMVKVAGLFKGAGKRRDDDDEKDEGPFKKWRSVRRDLLDPEGRFSRKPFMPFRQFNEPSSALSAPFGGPFSGISTGFQPSQKQTVFGSVAMAVPQAVMRLAFLLAQSLERAANGTPMDGNCLYHAVIQAQNGGQVDHAAAAQLRQETVQWVLADANLPAVSQYAFEHGTNIDSLIDTLSRNGNWSGAPGDLTPQVVASAIGRNIQINTSDGQVHVIPPLAGPAAATVIIELDLGHQHYSVPHAPPQASSSSSNMNIGME